MLKKSKQLTKLDMKKQIEMFQVCQNQETGECVSRAASLQGTSEEAEIVIQEHWNFPVGVTIIVADGPDPTLLV